MKRYRLTGMFDACGIEEDPEGFLVRYDDVQPLIGPVLALLNEPVMAALVDYADKLGAWDAKPHEGVHSFESAGLDDGLRAALRAERAKAGAA